jgi:nucleoid DNA-binding protein
MNKKELIETVTKNHAGRGLSKKSVADIIDDTFAAIAKGIKKAGGFPFRASGHLR